MVRTPNLGGSHLRSSHCHWKSSACSLSIQLLFPLLYLASNPPPHSPCLPRAPVHAARSLFRKTRLFVAAHGAALTNMMFMPMNSTVLEIRPRGWGRGCLRTLAYACSINYYLSIGEGGKTSDILPHMDDIELQLSHIHNVYRYG